MTQSATRSSVSALCIVLSLLLAPVVAGQTIIEPGPPGTINDMVHGDTTATGERNSCHYVLRRDAVYIYNARITLRADCEWIFEAEDGTGARPLIKPAALPGGEESPRHFHLFANTTLHLRNLHLDSYDTSLPEPGRPSDNATVRVGADSARVVIDGVRFDRNRQSTMRSDNAHTSFFVTNSEFSNNYNVLRPDQSFIMDTRGNQLDSLVFVNNTIWNHGNTITRNANAAKINYYKFDHNTFVNVAGVFAADGRLDTLRAEEPGEQDEGVIDLAQSDYAVFRNNLLVNVGMVGTEANDAFIPRFILDIDSALVEVDSVTFTMNPPMGVDIRNNVVSFDVSIASAYPDTIRLYTPDELTDPTLDLFLAAGQTVQTNLIESVSLNDAPVADPQFVMDYWDFATGARERQALLFNRDSRTAGGEGMLDFAYPSSALAYMAGTDGMPVGDLNWFGMAEGYVGGDDMFAVISTAAEDAREVPDAFTVHGNYPNPFNPSTTIIFDLPFEATVGLVVFDVLGRAVYTVPAAAMEAGSNRQVSVDGGRLASGLYLYQVRAETPNGRIVRTGKMMLLK